VGLEHGQPTGQPAAQFEGEHRAGDAPGRGHQLHRRELGVEQAHPQLRAVRRGHTGAGQPAAELAGQEGRGLVQLADLGLDPRADVGVPPGGGDGVDERVQAGDQPLGEPVNPLRRTARGRSGSTA
jgi:hypothetical protein